MLTDLHVHLRPDEPPSEASRYFTAANAELYAQTAAERGIGFLGVSEHVYRFRQALEVWRHPFWERQAVDDLDAYCDFVRNSTSMALGIEVDYVPGRERETERLLAGRDFDYVIGSVHFIGDGAVDMAGHWDVWRRADADTIWSSYFELVGRAAESGLFDIVAHPDLVKIWGRQRRPSGNLRRFYEPAVERLAGAQISVEVSTAGLRKPVAEIYPEPEFLDMCIARGLAVALSSDAHRPQELGFRYTDALAFLRDRGVDTVAVYKKRKRRLEPLG